MYARFTELATGEGEFRQLGSGYELSGLQNIHNS